MHISQRDYLCVQMTDRCRLHDKVQFFFAGTILLAYAREVPKLASSGQAGHDHSRIHVTRALGNLDS
jgi:hypothetical protein